MLLMRADDFTYTFPDKLIAKYPPAVRGQSRLLVLNRKSGDITHCAYADMVNYLQSGDVLVLNDTKVIKARIIARNTSGGTRELLLIEKHAQDKDWHTHRCLYRGKLEQGEKLKVGQTELEILRIEAGGIALVQSTEDLALLAEKYGSVPLPPYMKREATEEDIRRYQTVFAKDPGSVAAPTASLNFTPELEQQLNSKGVVTVYLTLHVGLGTFLPIRTDELESHHMHSEYFEIPEQTVKQIQQARQRGRKIIALGTTVARTLEFAHQQILSEEPRLLSGEADIFIYPGYSFHVVDGLLTNFHAPRSTVLMLAAAFAGWDHLHHAYEDAVKKEYALLSYGDSMLIL